MNLWWSSLRLYYTCTRNLHPPLNNATIVRGPLFFCYRLILCSSNSSLLPPSPDKATMAHAFSSPSFSLCNWEGLPVLEQQWRWGMEPNDTTAKSEVFLLLKEGFRSPRKNTTFLSLLLYGCLPILSFLSLAHISFTWEIHGVQSAIIFGSLGLSTLIKVCGVNLIKRYRCTLNFSLSYWAAKLKIEAKILK
jgi:hypothetical protein